MVISRPTALTFAVLFALLPLEAAAQDAGAGRPLEIGRTFRLESRALGEQRLIDVSLPRGYDADSARHPVIVVLDGDPQVEAAAAIARSYALSGMMPRAIVVGVRNTNRMRDFTPAPAPGFQVPPQATGAGGADNFLRFVADELLPWVDRNYRTAPMRVLVGHSLGGLFALHALAQRPTLFTGWVVMEPSTWWNERREFNAAKAMLRQPDARRARVMLVNTESIGMDTTQWGGNAPMVRHLATTGETHESMAAAGMLHAFRTMFEDFRPSRWIPGTRPVAMLERYDSLAARVGYDVPISANAYERTIRMSIHARHWEDAERMIVRMERAFGAAAAGDLRQMLAEERTTPVPDEFIPLVIPATRPTPAQAARFMGRWVKAGEGAGHEITVRASGDTIVVRDRIQFPDGTWTEGDHHVITVTDAGVLEWGLPWFRGIAALVVQMGEILPDGTMRVTREPRGWVPRGPGGEMHSTTLFRRVDR